MLLQVLDILCKFFSILYNADNFCDFLLAYMLIKSILKRCFLKGEQIRSFRISAFPEGSQTNFSLSVK